MVECNLPKVEVAGSIPVSRFYTAIKPPQTFAERVVKWNLSNF